MDDPSVGEMSTDLGGRQIGAIHQWSEITVFADSSNRPPGSASQPSRHAIGDARIDGLAELLQSVGEIQRRQTEEGSSRGVAGLGGGGDLFRQQQQGLVYGLLGHGPPGGELATGDGQDTFLFPQLFLATGLRRFVGVGPEDRSQAGEQGDDVVF